MTSDLYQALFAPAAVALVGASDVPGKATARPLHFLRRHGWAGDVYPINAKRETVLGERAWASLKDLPAVPEHALVLTPADAAVEAVRQCAELGVTVATVVADGFLPGTADGDRRRQELREIIDDSTLRLLGPSSLGVATIADRPGPHRQRRVRRASSAGRGRLRRLTVRQRPGGSAVTRGGDGRRLRRHGVGGQRVRHLAR